MNTWQERETAYAAFLRYFKAQSPETQKRLRLLYQNERDHMKAGVMRYMRLTGNLQPR